MAAESAARFEALEDQAEGIIAVFARAGYERVAPSIIQPADIFLDRVGEAIRSRTYIFTDPDGQELCLRPDLTIPTCRIYLERNPRANREARYAYNGPAFRFQRGKPDALRPREFRQAGIECFGVADREQAEAECLSLTLEAVRGGISLEEAFLGLVGGQDLEAVQRQPLVEAARPDVPRQHPEQHRGQAAHGIRPSIYGIARAVGPSLSRARSCRPGSHRHRPHHGSPTTPGRAP